MTCVQQLSDRNREVNQLNAQVNSCNQDKNTQKAQSDLALKTVEEKLTAERDAFKNQLDAATRELLTFKDTAKAAQDEAVAAKYDDFKVLLDKKDQHIKDINTQHAEAVAAKDTTFNSLLANKDQHIKDINAQHAQDMVALETKVEDRGHKSLVDMQKKCFHVSKEAFFNSVVGIEMQAFLNQRDASGNFNIFDGTNEDFVRIHLGTKQQEFIPKALSQLEKDCGTFLSEPFAWYTPEPTGLLLSQGDDAKPTPAASTEEDSDDNEDVVPSAESNEGNPVVPVASAEEDSDNNEDVAPSVESNEGNAITGSYVLPFVGSFDQCLMGDYALEVLGESVQCPLYINGTN